MPIRTFSSLATLDPTVEPRQQLAAVRTQVKAVLGADAAAGGRYAWAFPAVGSTDESVRTYVEQHPPTLYYEPCLYTDHLTAASSLLDKCLARRDQIFALEAAAMMSVLDYANAEALQPNDLALAKVGLKAARNQAKAGDGDATEQVLVDQDTIKTQARNARLLLHQQPGNALNYAERIGELRELMGDDVRSIQERLRAARIGMHQAGVAPNLPPAPEWTAARSDNLMQLVKWCRNAIRQIDVNSQLETIYKIALFLKGDKLVKEDAVKAALASEVAVSLSFTLDDSKFSQTGPFRILNFGTAIAFEDAFASAVAGHAPIHAGVGDGDFGFDEDPGTLSDADEDRQRALQRADRRNLSFRTIVTLPTQRAKFSAADEAEHTWTRPLLDSSDVLVWDSLGAQPFTTIGQTQYLNANPIGDWKLWLGPEMRTSNSVQTRGSSTRGGHQVDIVLFMTVASLCAPKAK